MSFVSNLFAAMIFFLKVYKNIQLRIFPMHYNDRPFYVITNREGPTTALHLPAFVKTMQSSLIAIL